MEASRTLQRPVLGDAVFDRLVRAHRAPLERYVRGLGASREDAEEIAATALLRAYQSPPAAHRDSEWRAWLSTVARNVFIDARRRRELRLVSADDVLESVPSDDASVDQIAATAEEARQICAAIALLPPAQRAAIYLREVRGLSYGEIAAQLGITIMAATAILQRARGNVKERRGGLSGALSALAFSPLALVRRGARLARSGGAYGAAVKVAVPVALMAGAGGAVVVAQHTASGVRPQTPSALTRSSSVGAALVARRNPLATRVPFAIRPPARWAGSSLRYVPFAQWLNGPLPGSSAPAAAAMTHTSSPATARVTVTVTGTTGAKHARNSGKPASGAHAQHARKAAAALHARNPSKHTRGSTPAGLRGVGAKRAAARPATAAAPSSHSPTAAQDKHAPVAHTAAAPAANGSAHLAATASAAPPAAAPASGVAPPSPAAVSSSASNAAPQAAPGVAQGPPAQAATPAGEPPSADGSANGHAPA